MQQVHKQDKFVGQSDQYCNRCVHDSRRLRYGEAAVCGETRRIRKRRTHNREIFEEHQGRDQMERREFASHREVVGQLLESHQHLRE